MGEELGGTAGVRARPTWTHQGWFLVAVYGMAVIWGVRSVYGGQDSTVDLLFRATMMIALAWWAIADSVARGRPIPTMSRNWFLLSAGLTVPCYVVWSRGWRGAGLLLLGLVAWYFVSITAMVACRIVMAVLGVA
jgi:hypothetical protein